MIFKEVQLTNFGVFGGSNRIVLNSDSTNERNITLIGGMNGRGKTTILEAILLVLYGRQSLAYRDSGLSYAQYLNKLTNDGQEPASAHSSLELVFDLPLDGDLVEFRLQRSWRREEHRGMDHLVIWRNGSIDSHLSKNWDVYIEDILPSGIAGLFFFDGEKIISLAENLSSQTTKRSIESLLGLDIIDRLLLDMKRIASKKEENLADLTSLQHTDDYRKEQELIELAIGRSKQKRAKLQNDIDKAQNALASSEQEFLAKGGHLDKGLTELKQEKTRIQEALIAKRSELASVAGSEYPLYLALPLLRSIQEANQLEQSAQVTQHIRPFLNRVASDIKQVLDNGSIPALEKSRIEELLQQEEKRLDNAATETEFSLSPIAQQQLEELLSLDIHEKLKPGTDLIEDVKELEAESDRVDRHLMADVDHTATNQLIKDIREHTRRLLALEAEKDKVEESTQDLERKRDTLQQTIQKALEEAVSKEEAIDDSSRIIKYALKTQKVMGEFRERLVLERVTDLAQRILACFNALVDKQDLVTAVDINPETYGITLLNNKHEEIGQSKLSAGERQMLAIAILWGLAEASGRNIPIIVDTPVGRLDSSHRRNFLLQYLPKASHQVVVLSTDQEVYGRYLENLEPYIARKYLLVFDEDRKATSVVEGYFQGGVS